VGDDGRYQCRCGVEAFGAAAGDVDGIAEGGESLCGGEPDA
jgi:hypothetical protein